VSAWRRDRDYVYLAVTLTPEIVEASTDPDGTAFAQAATEVQL